MKKFAAALILAGGMSALFAAGDAVKLTPDENSAAFWDMSVIKDGKIPDGSGYGNDITFGIKNDAAQPKISPEGLVFDGQGGYAFVKPKDSLRIKGDFTVEIVFKNSDPNPKTVSFYLIGNKAATEKTSGFSFRYMNWGGKFLCFDYALNGKAETFKAKLPKALERDVWHYAAIVRKGDKLSCYLNGVLLAEETVAGAMELYQLRPVIIGIYCAPWQKGKDGKLILNAFKGVIKSIRISDTAREIASAAK